MLLQQVRSGKNRCGAPARFGPTFVATTVGPTVAATAAVGPTAQENPETNSLCSLGAVIFLDCCDPPFNALSSFGFVAQ